MRLQISFYSRRRGLYGHRRGIPRRVPTRRYFSPIHHSSFVEVPASCSYSTVSSSEDTMSGITSESYSTSSSSEDTMSGESYSTSSSDSSLSLTSLSSSLTSCSLASTVLLSDERQSSCIESDSYSSIKSYSGESLTVDSLTSFSSLSTTSAKKEKTTAEEQLPHRPNESDSDSEALLDPDVFPWILINR